MGVAWIRAFSYRVPASGWQACRPSRSPRRLPFRVWCIRTGVHPVRASARCLLADPCTGHPRHCRRIDPSQHRGTRGVGISGEGTWAGPRVAEFRRLHRFTLRAGHRRVHYRIHRLALGLLRECPDQRDGNLHGIAIAREVATAGRSTIRSRRGNPAGDWCGSDASGCNPRVSLGVGKPADHRCDRHRDRRNCCLGRRRTAGGAPTDRSGALQKQGFCRCPGIGLPAVHHARTGRVARPFLPGTCPAPPGQPDRCKTDRDPGHERGDCPDQWLPLGPHRGTDPCGHRGNHDGTGTAFTGLPAGRRDNDAPAHQSAGDRDWAVALPRAEQQCHLRECPAGTLRPGWRDGRPESEPRPVVRTGDSRCPLDRCRACQRTGRYL